MASAPTFVIEIDWNNDGDFSDSYENVTKDVRFLKFARGKESELGRAKMGTAELRLNNMTNKYSPLQAASPIYGNVKLKRKVRVRTTAPIVKNHFTGYLEDLNPHPQLSEAGSIYFKASDEIEFLNRQELDTVLYKSKGTGYLVDKILDAAYGNLVTNGSFEDSDPPDDWTLTGAGASRARSTAQFKTGEYSVLLTRSGADCTLYQSLTDYADYAGAVVTFGCWIYATVASRARLHITDGVGTTNSSYHTGVTGWEWITVTRTIDNSPSELTVALVVDTGDTSAYFDGAVLMNGTRVPYGKVLDGGQDTVPYAYWHQVKARFAIGEIEDSELGFFLINGDGSAVYEDRHHRYSATHQTSQATFDNTMKQVFSRTNSSRLYNEARATVTPWELQSLAEVWRLEETPYFEIGETKTYWGDFEFFADAITTPVSSTDYTANTEAGGGGTDKTSDITIVTTKFAKSVRLDVTNGATVPVYLTLLKVRATYYDDKTKVTRKTEDADSIATYMRRTLTLDGKYLTDADQAQDFCDYAVARFKDEQPEILIDLVNRNDALLEEILTREVSDRITIVHDAEGLDGDYFIDSIELTADSGGQLVTAKWRLASAENEAFATLGYSRLDDPGCKLAY